MPLTRLFPNLGFSDYQVTSPPSADYNCIAWAALEDDRWWWPDPNRIFYWPEDAPREETLDGFVKTFELYGYESCTSTEIEVGFEKVAIFVDADGEPTHMARQMQSGGWTSKLGTLEDIEHSLRGLEGDRYGIVAAILRRPIRSL